MSAANRSRGGRYENEVAKYVRTVGFPDARRYLAGDGRQPGDIDGVPGVCIEAKDVAQSAWPSWRHQALTEARGRVPIVVRRTRGVTDVGQHLANVMLADEPNPESPHIQTFCFRTNAWWVTGTFATMLPLAVERARLLAAAAGLEEGA